jgi:hypothetical protein
MRHASPLALLLLTVSLAGCGGAHREFVVRREACEGGRRIGLRIPAWKEKHIEGLEREVAEASSGSLAGGFTLVTVNGYGRDRFALLHLLTPDCELDRGYGTNGTMAITFPSSLRPAHPPPGEEPEGLSFRYAGAASGGGAFLAGDDEGKAVVGEVTRRGTLDRSFGKDGWVLLPFGGTPQTILQERSGQIVLDGNESLHPRPTPTLAWVSALSPRGRLDTSFGGHGRVTFYTGPVWSIRTMELEPNGDILVDDQGGRMGNYSIELAMLSPSGEPVPHFVERIARFWKALGFRPEGYGSKDRAGTFSGNVFVQGDGFTLAGMGHRESLEDLDRVRPPRAPGLIARFKPDGELAGTPIRFRSEMLWSVTASPEGHHIMLEGTSWEHPNRQVRIVLEPDGQRARSASHQPSI